MWEHFAYKIFKAFLSDQERKQRERTNAVRQLAAVFQSPEPEREWTEQEARLVTEAKVWVRMNLIDNAVVVFDEEATMMRMIETERYAVTGAVDVAIDGREPVRNWFVVGLTDAGNVVFGEILESNPLGKE